MHHVAREVIYSLWLLYTITIITARLRDNNVNFNDTYEYDYILRKPPVGLSIIQINV